MADGDRTRDHRNHNPVLYQLSYSHHWLYCCALDWMAHPAGFEPATDGLEGRCSIQLSYGRSTRTLQQFSNLGLSESGRGRGIRTPDILLPKQARYQTALFPAVTQDPSFRELRMILATTGFVNQKAPAARRGQLPSQGQTEVRKCPPFDSLSGAFRPWQHSSSTAKPSPSKPKRN